MIVNNEEDIIMSTVAPQKISSSQMDPQQDLGDPSLEGIANKVSRLSVASSGGDYAHLVSQFEAADREEKKIAKDTEDWMEKCLDDHETLMTKRDNPNMCLQRGDSVQERRNKLQTREKKRNRIRKSCCLCRAIYKCFLKLCPPCMSKTVGEPKLPPPDQIAAALREANLI